MDPNESPAHRGGPSWIELSVALTAVIVSVASLFIARRQTMVMDRQLAASVWPVVQYSTSNVRGEERVITLSVENVGIGPARIRAFKVLHKGQEVVDPSRFIKDCCARGDAPFKLFTGFVEGRVIPAGEEVTFLTLQPDPRHPAVFDSFNRVRTELDVRVCYCSVLDDCWITTRDRRDPESVASCASMKAEDASRT